MSKQNDKTALKLLNKYADAHKALEEENKALRVEINDLKTTLRLNKGIIEDLFRQTNAADKNNSYILKLKEEIKSLSHRNEKLVKEKEELAAKLNYLEQVSNESVLRGKEEFEQLKSKNFLLENLLTKKENQNQVLRRKLDKYEIVDLKNQIFEREVYVVDPHLAVNQVYEELLMYKQVYENLAEYIKDTRKSNSKLEKALHERENEVIKLRDKLKKIKTSNNMNSYMLYANTPKQPMTANNKSVNTVINLGEGYKITDNLADEDGLKSPMTNYDKQVCNSQNTRRMIKPNNSQIDLKKKTNFKTTNYECEEWIDIMKNVNMHPEEYDKFSRNKMLTKLIDAIEMLNRLVMDKNLQINVLEEENKSLNEKNKDLNNENMNLIAKNAELFSNYNNMKLKFSSIEAKMDKQAKEEQNKLRENASPSNIMIRNLNINSINAINHIVDPIKKQINSELNKGYMTYNVKNKSVNTQNEETHTADETYQTQQDSVIDNRKQINKVVESIGSTRMNNLNHMSGYPPAKQDALTLESITSSEMHEDNVNVYDSGFVSMRNEIEKFGASVKKSNL